MPDASSLPSLGRLRLVQAKIAAISWRRSGLLHLKTCFLLCGLHQAGEVTKSMIRALSAETVFLLNKFLFEMPLVNGFRLVLTSPGSIQLLLANFLYSLPG